MTYTHQQPEGNKQQQGFTLVELAVVMTIIGLLIGGILKGQELMENARVTSTVAQAKGIEAAVTSFRDAYNAMPGDMPQASTRIPGCTAGCNNANTTAAGSGNGIVGSATYGSGTSTWAAQGSSVSNAAATDEAAETGLFWLHLLQANLLGGTTNQSLAAAQNYAWGITHPAARITGGFAVGNATGSNIPGDPTAGTHGPVGHVIALLLTPTSGVGTVTTGNGVLTPARAAQLDRKVDDGGPVSGSVQAYGLVANCQGTAAAPGFNEASTARDCGLVFRIQN